MANTNFTLFNPAAANQENDSTYAADTTRSGGAVSGPWAPQSANKTLYQPNMMARAIALMLANKGFSTTDGTTPFTADTTTNAAATALATVLANLLTTADRPVLRDTTQHSHTGDTTNDIISTLSSGALLNTSIVRITGKFTTITQGTGATIVLFYVAGTQYSGITIVSAGGSQTYEYEILINNQGSTTSTDMSISYKASSIGSNGEVQFTQANVQLGVNTASGITFELQVQNANNSDHQVFDLAMMEVFL